LARKQKQRSHIVAFTHAYHGHSLGSLALTANEYYHDDHYGSQHNVSHVPFDGYIEGVDTAAWLERLIADPSSGLPLPAAVILETIQGEGGINVASAPWLRRIERICRDNDILLIIDDIQVGNGRTGRFFSFEESGITPDIVTLSKSIAGGLPMSLVLMRPEIDVWRPGEHTGTFRGNNLAFVTAKELLSYWANDELRIQIQSHAESIVTRLRCVCERYRDLGFATRGRGMIQGLDVRSGALAKEIIRRSFESGLIIEAAGAHDEVLKVMPALTIDRVLLDEGMEKLEAIIAQAVQVFGHQPHEATVPQICHRDSRNNDNRAANIMPTFSLSAEHPSLPTHGG
jgi:diaminobutyrate-2-oxoglutarate transaminase